MSKIRINSITIQNYRSFGNEPQTFNFPDIKKPISIVGYNNAGKTNLMNSILFTLGISFVSKDTFSIDDFHDKKIKNRPEILLNATSTIEQKFDKEKMSNLSGYHKLVIYTDGDEIAGSKIQSLNSLQPKINRQGIEQDDENYQAFGASRYYNIFYINFHKIKDEIATQKSSWGNLRSFLAKHIKKLVDEDDIMKARKVNFEKEVRQSTNDVLKGKLGTLEQPSNLIQFIEKIRTNYCNNLRDNNCNVDFGLPEYEDIFLQMMFKIGLNGNSENLVPIDHFGDGYISMFVMSVIQAIAESNSEDKCLFLFEEPESFLHENHQEYFYKMVLCTLAENGHQVIYTTHSDKMVDIFDTQSLIRLEFDKNKKATASKFDNSKAFNNPIIVDEDTSINLSEYNSVIRNIEPNLNKILFSNKVILVEGPNDLMVYSYIIKQKVKAKFLEKNRLELELDEEKKAIKIEKLYLYAVKYAESYLNFHNIVIIPHHGKATAYLLAKLCEHINVDYFLINDWDFEIDKLPQDSLSGFTTEEKLKESNLYIYQANTNLKGMVTTNWKLLQLAKPAQIHFNVPKLESVIGYTSDDKSAIKIWSKLKEMTNFNTEIFPMTLEYFLEFYGIKTITIPEVQIPVENYSPQSSTIPPGMPF